MTRMAAPLLSVVTPVFNRQAACARLLDELAAQGRDRPGAMEIIVVDDASTPPFALPAGVAATLIRAPRRGGANAARRLGLAAARGRFVHFHDSDDGVAPGWLAAVLDKATAEVEIIVTRRWDESGGARRAVSQDWFERNAHRPARVRRMLTLINCMGPLGGVTFSRACLEGASFRTMASSQDWALYREVYRRDRRAAIAAQARFVYRLDGDDRISRSARRKALGMFALDAPRRRDSAGAVLRLWRLHQFRAHLRACDREALRAVMRRTRLARVVVGGLGAAYLALGLGRW